MWLTLEHFSHSKQNLWAHYIYIPNGFCLSVIPAMVTFWTYAFLMALVCLWSQQWLHSEIWNAEDDNILIVSWETEKVYSAFQEWQQTAVQMTRWEQLLLYSVRTWVQISSLHKGGRWTDTGRSLSSVASQLSQLVRAGFLWQTCFNKTMVDENSQF